MKITANQIEKGMKVKVSDINDKTSYLINAINGVTGYGIHSDDEKNKMQFLIENDMVLYIPNGSIKKNSPIVTILDIYTGDSNGTYHNGRLFVNNNIWLITDYGKIEISNRQKVELV